MTRLFRHSLILLATALVFLMAGAMQQADTYAQEAQGSPAEQNLQTVDSKGNRSNCRDLPEAQGVLVGVLVPCIINTIENTTERFSEEMITWLMPTVYAFVFFVIVMFGVKVLQGGQAPHVQGFLLLVKLTFVLAFLQMIPHTFVPLFYEIMAESQQIVAGAIGPEQGIRCDIRNYDSSATPQVWAHMDCLLGKLYGFTTGTMPNGDKSPNMLLASSIFGLLGGFFFGGTFGMILFFSCLGVLWTMFQVVLRTVVAFLNGYLYAAILFIISPLFLPLTLLPATARYFDPWVKGLLASVLLPIIISAYSMFALLLYDRMLFSDDALVNKLFNNELVQQMQGLPRELCDVRRPANPEQRAASTGVAENILYGNSTIFGNAAAPLTALANNQCIGLKAPDLDVLKGLDLDSQKEAYTELFLDCVMLLLVAFLISNGLTHIITLSRLLVGSGGVASTLDARGPIEEKFETIKQSAQAGIRDGLNDPNTGRTTYGTDFITRLAAVPGTVSERINDAMKKD